MRAYLAGPVDPTLLDVCLRWRREAAVALARRGITAVDPCRGGNHPEPDPDGTLRGFPVSAQRLVARDKADIRTCNAVLVYWPAASVKKGIGTIMEIALSASWGLPVLLVDPGEQITDHPWVQVHVTEHHGSLDEAIEALAGYWRDADD